MALAIDPVARDRERELNGKFVIAILATLVFVTMTFGALAVVFFIRSRNNFEWTKIILPPVLWADTAILLASSFTYEKGHRKLRANDQRGFFEWTRYTTILGVLFLIGQFAAWWQILAAGQVVRSNPHSSFFFLFSGLHGLHIVAGLSGLSVLLYRTHEPASGPNWQMHTRALANAFSLFWHYLDGLWIVLFTLLLLVGR